MQAPPVCYRHPDRETYVRCTRCERPICPDCMRPASVGFQCPECVAEGGRTVRQGRTVFGGRVSGDTSRVTIAIIGLNVAVFVLGLAGGAESLILRFANLAGPVLIDGELAGVATGQYYRLFTAAFLHANIIHIALNMFALAQLGPTLESALGRVRFLTLYVLAALGGSTLSFVLTAPGLFALLDGTSLARFLPEPGQPGVGASGAIFGLFGAYYVIVRRLGGETRSIVTLLIVNLVITFSVPIIDWRAHLGGLLTGAVIASAFADAPRGERRDTIQAAACVGVAVLLVLAIGVRTTVLAV